MCSGLSALRDRIFVASALLMRESNSTAKSDRSSVSSNQTSTHGMARLATLVQAAKTSSIAADISANRSGVFRRFQYCLWTRFICWFPVPRVVVVGPACSAPLGHGPDALSSSTELSTHLHQVCPRLSVADTGATRCRRRNAGRVSSCGLPQEAAARHPVPAANWGTGPPDIGAYRLQSLAS